MLHQKSETALACPSALNQKKKGRCSTRHMNLNFNKLLYGVGLMNSIRFVLSVCCVPSSFYRSVVYSFARCHFCVSNRSMPFLGSLHSCHSGGNLLHFEVTRKVAYSLQYNSIMNVPSVQTECAHYIHRNSPILSLRPVSRISTFCRHEYYLFSTDISMPSAS